MVIYDKGNEYYKEAEEYMVKAKKQAGENDEATGKPKTWSQYTAQWKAADISKNLACAKLLYINEEDLSRPL